MCGRLQILSNKFFNYNEIIGYIDHALLVKFQNSSASSKNPAAKLMTQPSISITPLPRTTSQTPLSGSGSSSKPGGKNTFVICEICDGYIKVNNRLTVGVSLLLMIDNYYKYYYYYCLINSFN